MWFQENIQCFQTFRKNVRNFRKNSRFDTVYSTTRKGDWNVFESVYGSIFSTPISHYVKPGIKSAFITHRHKKTSFEYFSAVDVNTPSPQNVANCKCVTSIKCVCIHKYVLLYNIWYFSAWRSRGDSSVILAGFYQLTCIRRWFTIRISNVRALMPVTFSLFNFLIAQKSVVYCKRAPCCMSEIWNKLTSVQ